MLRCESCERKCKRVIPVEGWQVRDKGGELRPFEVCVRCYRDIDRVRKRARARLGDRSVMAGALLIAAAALLACSSTTETGSSSSTTAASSSSSAGGGGAGGAGGELGGGGQGGELGGGGAGGDGGAGCVPAGVPCRVDVDTCCDASAVCCPGGGDIGACIPAAQCGGAGGAGGGA